MFRQLVAQEELEGDDDDTNDYLRDTISLMTAMEARISSEETSRGKNSPKKEAATVLAASSCNSTPTKRRPKTTTELRKSANNSAAAKAKEAKDRAAQQWQRRKNYDPLKSMAKAKLAAKGDQYTDESSDVDSASASGCSFSQKSNGPANPRLAMIRSDGGRHSLRHQQHSSKDSDQQPQSLGSPSRYQPRPPFRTNVTSQNGGRSTSSLSSREAEFQVGYFSCLYLKKIIYV